MTAAWMQILRLRVARFGSSGFHLDWPERVDLSKPDIAGASFRNPASSLHSATIRPEVKLGQAGAEV